MRRRFTFAAVLAGAVLLAGVPAFAQAADEDEDYDDGRDFALGVGIGLVEPGGSTSTQTYLMAALRIPAGRGSGARAQSQRGAVEGYLEPEIGYWEDDAGASDLLAGVNLIGVLPLGAVDSFFGVGAGVHFIDGELLDPATTDSETKFGANAQFGIDLHVSDSWSLFGAGRYDLVQDAPDDIQGKIYLGIRGRW